MIKILWYVTIDQQKTGEKKLRDKDPSENEYKELTKKGIEIIREKYDLSREEEVALKQIDAMKNELVHIYRFKQSSGNDRFDLEASVSNKLHDDRAYVFVMACHFLQQLRREHLVSRKKPEAKDILNKLQINPGKPLNKLFG